MIQGSATPTTYPSGTTVVSICICKSKNHCAELCDQNKSITKQIKVTTMTASTEKQLVLLLAIYVKSQGNVKLGTVWDLCSTDDTHV